MPRGDCPRRRPPQSPGSALPFLTPRPHAPDILYGSMLSSKLSTGGSRDVLDPRERNLLNAQHVLSARSGLALADSTSRYSRLLAASHRSHFPRCGRAAFSSASMITPAFKAIAPGSRNQRQIALPARLRQRTANALEHCASGFNTNLSGSAVHRRPTKAAPWRRARDKLSRSPTGLCARRPWHQQTMRNTSGNSFPRNGRAARLQSTQSPSPLRGRT